MNQQETEQFAALRMHVAHLHNALSEALEAMRVGATPPSLADRLEATLALSEPELRAMVLAIHEDEGVLAALRSEALSAAAAGCQAHHEDVRKAIAAGDAAVAYANQQLQEQGSALIACRAELQSKADSLAHVTARLAKIEAKATALVAAYDSEVRSNNETSLPLEVVVDLAEALK